MRIMSYIHSWTIVRVGGMHAHIYSHNRTYSQYSYLFTQYVIVRIMCVCVCIV